MTINNSIQAAKPPENPRETRGLGNVRFNHVISNAMRDIVKGGAHAAEGVDVPEFVGKSHAWDMGCGSDAVVFVSS